METKHSPGPWKAQRDIKGYHAHDGAPGRPRDGAWNPNDPIQCRWAVYADVRIACLEEPIDGMPQMRTEEECTANARLIAAAPDLADALRACVKRYADILDNCLFPASGLKANLTPERAAWREKVKAWKAEAVAALTNIEARP